MANIQPAFLLVSGLAASATGAINLVTQLGNQPWGVYVTPLVYSATGVFMDTQIQQRNLLSDMAAGLKHGGFAMLGFRLSERFIK